MQVVRLTPHWAAVLLPDGSAGWVARSFTSIGNRSAAGHGRAAGHAPPRHATPVIILRVAVGVVNIHSGPGQRRPVIARALHNAPLQLLGLTTHWAHIALPATSIEGWVLRRLLWLAPPHHASTVRHHP
jgi:SH3-like domain-containing protein